jgi:16S rRNA (uracil1498-N3)-methyltransferase
MRWKTIAVEACKQSGNPFLPRISYAEGLEKVAFEMFDAKFFGGLSPGAKSLKSVMARNYIAKNICMAIGPEGDFSVDEYARLKSSGFIECKLCRNVLRSETAAICSLTIMDQLTMND